MRVNQHFRRWAAVALVAFTFSATAVIATAQPASASLRFVSVAPGQAQPGTWPGDIASATCGNQPFGGICVEGPYQIFATPHPNICMDAASETVGRNGGKIQTFPCNGSRNQKWWFDETSVPGLYRIRSLVNGKCMDADNRFGGADLSLIQVWDCLGPGQLNQFWWLERDASDPANSLRLVTDMNPACALADDVWARGATIVLFRCLGQPQARWLMRDA